MIYPCFCCLEFLEWMRQMVIVWISEWWTITNVACFGQLYYFHPIESHLTKEVPCCLNESAQRSESAATPYWARAKWSSFLHSTASSFRLVEAAVLRGIWMNGGFMEMRKCNGTLFSIPAAGTVALCVFYQRHERRTISLSAINNMVSFEADYPSVGVKGNKRLGDNRQSLEPRFLLPWGNPPFCFVLIQKNLICQCAHSLSYVETFHAYCP